MVLNAFFFKSDSQFVDIILNKIANPFNKTYTGRKSMTQGFGTH